MDIETSDKIKIPELGLPRIVIVGGGFAGLNLAKALQGAKAQIILFDKNNHHTFQPLLYQVATSGLESNAIVYPLRKSLWGQNNIYFRMGEVIEIQPQNNTLFTSIGSLHYDYLVVATGANTNYFGNQQIPQYAYQLKSIEDAIELRNLIIRNLEQALLTDNEEVLNSLIDYVIVGGGPTGVEMAGALAELKKHVFPKDYREIDFREMDIHLINSSPRLLQAMSEPASEKAKEFLEKMGVRISLNQRVLDYDGEVVTLNSGEKIRTKLLIWAAGVEGAPIAGVSDDCYLPGKRLKVNGFNQVVGYENIFAIGDVACMSMDEYPKGHPMMAQPAIQQGKHLAKNFRNLLSKKPLQAFKYIDKGSMATIGRNKAVADLKTMKLQGFFAWVIWVFVHLMFLIGFRNRVMVFFNWAISYFSFDKSNRLIIGKPRARQAKEPSPRV
jgi:NADH:ubiquinone reductase (H+-translocating)